MILNVKFLINFVSNIFYCSSMNKKTEG